MTADWKDALASLRDAVPAAEDNNEPELTTEKEPTQRTALHVVTDRKARKGKTATIIEGFELPEEKVAEVATQLRKKLGTGGSARGGEILLQGDCKIKAIEALAAMGFKTKG